MPFFSVIIPTYNRAELLKETLESVFKQDRQDFEVIVIDDGSKDETLKVLADYGDRIRFFQQDNRGPGAARNLGIKHAIGTYLTFLDSDDLWFPWTLRTYAAVITETNNPSFLAGCPKRFASGQALSAVQETAPTWIKFADYYASGDEWRWWSASSFVVRRDKMVEVDGYANERVNGEDADMAMRLGVAPGFVQITNPCTFAYREHSGNIMQNVALTLLGVEMQLKTEQSNGYPGGGLRAGQRRQILTRQVRSLALDCLTAGRRDWAWRLFRATFRWHIAMGRWRFLLGYWLKSFVTRK